MTVRQDFKNTFKIFRSLVSQMILFHIFPLFALALLLNSPALAASPNIILCMADDQGWEEVAYNGHPELKTPVLDEMARTGFRFDRFYSAASNCGPTRGSVMTGRHSFRFGQFGPTWAMRPEEITIAEILQNNGYATAHYGKWHLGPVKADAPNNPGNSGFDEWLSHDNFFGIDPPLSRNGAPPETHIGESSEIIVRAAISFIEKAAEKEQPFFTVIWFGSCHGPYEAYEQDRKLYEHLDNEKLPDRYGEITAMDRAIGHLREALREQKVAGDTILWYCSDNGLPAHSWYHPKLNGGKGNLFEGGVRVPAIIEWPNGIKKPANSSVRSVTSDILPTICDVVDLPLPDRILDGISLVPLLHGNMKTRPEPIRFWHYESSPEYQNKRWMDAAGQKGTTPTHSNPATEFRNFHHPVAKTSNFGGDAAIIDDRYKLIVDQSGRHRYEKRTLTPVSTDVTLFDLLEDPAETTNLASSKPEVVKKLTRQLRIWQASVEKSMTGAEYLQN